MQTSVFPLFLQIHKSAVTPAAAVETTAAPATGMVWVFAFEIYFKHPFSLYFLQFQKFLDEHKLVCSEQEAAELGLNDKNAFQHAKHLLYDDLKNAGFNVGRARTWIAAFNGTTHDSQPHNSSLSQQSMKPAPTQKQATRQRLLQLETQMTNHVKNYLSTAKGADNSICYFPVSSAIQAHQHSQQQAALRKEDKNRQQELAKAQKKRLQEETKLEAKAAKERARVSKREETQKKKVEAQTARKQELVLKRELAQKKKQQEKQATALKRSKRRPKQRKKQKNEVREKELESEEQSSSSSADDDDEEEEEEEEGNTEENEAESSEDSSGSDQGDSYRGSSKPILFNSSGFTNMLAENMNSKAKKEEHTRLLQQIGWESGKKGSSASVYTKLWEQAVHTIDSQTLRRRPRRAAPSRT